MDGLVYFGWCHDRNVFVCRHETQATSLGSRMTTVLIGALLIGITIGMLGSGGSTITVPILVYLVGHSAKVSIAESMAIVGIVSMIAAFGYTRAKQVDWQSVWLFGIPGMIGTFVGAWLGGLATDAMQLIVFGIVLLMAAGFMIHRAFFCSKQDNQEEAPGPIDLVGKVKILLEGLVIGVLTGFVGVGGGFLIVPALVVFAKLPMRLAIGTSLVIVALKSAIGFAKYQQILLSSGMTVDWQTIGIFVAIGVIGSLVGKRINAKLNQRSLQKVFAVFLVLIGCFVIVKESSNLISQSTTTAEASQTLDCRICRTTR